MHIKVFVKLKKTLKTLSSRQKNPKNPVGWVFFKKTRVFSNPGTKSLASSLKMVSFSERMRRGRRRGRSIGRRRRMWRSRGRRMRSRQIGLCSHLCPVNKGLHVLAAYQQCCRSGMFIPDPGSRSKNRDERQG
jgi:hypothetical protein